MWCSGVLCCPRFSHIVEGGEGCSEERNSRTLEEVLGQGRQQFLEIGPAIRIFKQFQLSRNHLYYIMTDIYILLRVQ